MDGIREAIIGGSYIIASAICFSALGIMLIDKSGYGLATIIFNMRFLPLILIVLGTGFLLAGLGYISASNSGKANK